jgi:hypothetical protein
VHELAIRQRVRRGDVHGSFDAVVLDDPLDGANEVVFVNPRHVLQSVAEAAEAEADLAKECVERAAALGAHHHRRAHLHFARGRHDGQIDLALPRLRDVSAEAPLRRRVRLVPAENAAVLVIRCVKAMGINRGGAHLQPHARRVFRADDGLSDDARGEHARLENLAAVLLIVTAVDAAAGEVDHGVGAVDVHRPLVERLAVPRHRQPGLRLGMAAEDDDAMPFLVERGGEQPAEVARASGDDDLHDLLRF